MPGVPSGRGCDACRKQKKKCDAAQPACSRCTRLGIDCTGGGQRRFKFIQIEEQDVTKQQKLPRKPQALVKLGKPSCALTSEVTSLASSFISSIGVKDPRFDLACYGVFLPLIPKRFAVYSGKPSYEALTKYGRALHVLRISLDKPEKEGVVELLCAIYFLLICQTWVSGPGDEIISHGKAVSQMLNAVAGKFTAEDLSGDFEHQVLVSMCMIVILEGVWDPTIKLHPWYRTNLMARHGAAKPSKRSEEGEGEARSGSSSEGLPNESITIETLSRIPDLIHAPRTHMSEIRNLYHRASLDAEELLKRQVTIFEKLAEGTYASPSSRDLEIERIIPLCQTAHSLLLTVALGCNAILSAFHPEDTILLDDSARFVDDTLSLAERVERYRPLGASHLPLCLIAAYTACSDLEKLKLLRHLLEEYQKDFASARWMEIAVHARKCRLVAHKRGLADCKPVSDGKTEQSPEAVDDSFCAVQ